MTPAALAGRTGGRLGAGRGQDRTPASSTIAARKVSRASTRLPRKTASNGSASIRALRNQRLSPVWEPTLIMVWTAVAKVKVVATAIRPPAVRRPVNAATAPLSCTRARQNCVELLTVLRPGGRAPVQ